ncbi:helix-turn-helix domain-containing protein [Sediminicola arcticus]|uniref:AraC family transcriptional regulator n=1 Tax=Sediminicola arcticus TaxID=1574308 RepID=A0ABV2STC6_9FLAO
MSGKVVSEVCYASSYESQSYFDRIFKKITDVNPREFRNKYSISQ